MFNLTCGKTIMNTHTLKVLEYKKIIELLSTYTSSLPGLDKIKLTKPLTDFNQITRLMAETTELKALLDPGKSLPVSGLFDLTPILLKLSDWNDALTVEDINQVGSTVRTARYMREMIPDQHEFPNLNRIIDQIDNFDELENRIEQILDQNGTIKDNASSRLKSLRKGIRFKRKKVQDKIHALVKSDDIGTYLQDSNIRENENRPTLAIMASHASKIKGERRGRSESGKTIFIEPDHIKHLGDELEKAIYEEKIEIQRLLGTITNKIVNQSEALKTTLKILVHLDVTYAKVRFSRKYNLNPPSLNTQGVVCLKRATHPLLWDPDQNPDVLQPTPIDIQIGQSFHSLIITGPNTGGKTVSLKTMGLLTLMAQSGMHIPASKGSKVAVFKKIFADIGDEQSIEQNLSTFSGHLTNIKEILNQADHQSLVLLDELGGGTDPAEGEALAESILNYLHHKNTRTIATTHISHLKNLAYTVDGFENGSIEFDLNTLKPTFRLLLGIPGSSNALSLAKRLGLPDEVIKKAQKRTCNDETAKLLNHLQKVRSSMTEDQMTIEASKQKAQVLESKSAQKLKELDLQLELAREQSGTQAVSQLEKVDQEILIILDKEPSKKQILAALKKLQENIKINNKNQHQSVLNVEDKVRIKSLNKTGKLKFINSRQQTVSVLIGSMSVEVPINDIFKID